MASSKLSLRQIHILYGSTLYSSLFLFCACLFLFRHTINIANVSTKVNNSIVQNLLYFIQHTAPQQIPNDLYKMLYFIQHATLLPYFADAAQKSLNN